MFELSAHGSSAQPGLLGGHLVHVITFALPFVVCLVVLLVVSVRERRRGAVPTDRTRQRAALLTAPSYMTVRTGPDPTLIPAPRPPTERAAVTTSADRQQALVYVIVAASVMSAAIHGIVCPEHFTEAVLFGLFFMFAAGAQLGWAGLLLHRRSPTLLQLGALGNGAVIVLWLVTRTVGLPFGPDPGVAEGIGTLDVLATSCELVVVVGAWSLLRAMAVQGQRTQDAAEVQSDWVGVAAVAASRR